MGYILWDNYPEIAYNIFKLYKPVFRRIVAVLTNAFDNYCARDYACRKLGNYYLSLKKSLVLHNLRLYVARTGYYAIDPFMVMYSYRKTRRKLVGFKKDITSYGLVENYGILAYVEEWTQYGIYYHQ